MTPVEPAGIAPQARPRPLHHAGLRAHHRPVPERRGPTRTASREPRAPPQLTSRDHSRDSKLDLAVEPAATSRNRSSPPSPKPSTCAAWRGSASRSPRPWSMPTSRAFSTATSSRRTCCSTPRARSGSPTSAWPRPRTADELTRTGDIVGTLRYMAPERFDGWSDPRSDVYALGATLYEMLTLRPAFDDDGPASG